MVLVLLVVIEECHRIMVNYFEFTTSILQNFSYLAQILMLVGLIFAWKQIKLGVEDIRLRSRREAGLLAIHQAETFAEKIIPQLNKLDELMRKIALKRREVNLVHFRMSELFDMGIHEREIYTQTLNKLYTDRETFDLIIDIANRMESIAMCFTKKLANEEVVFDSLATLYCQFVRSHYFFIALKGIMK